jgi:hypothetical protein
VRTDEATVAAGHSRDPARRREAFEVTMGRIARRFARVEPRLRARRLVLGLLSDLPRKNCWTIAEWAGEKTPHGMQHLLCRASWDADAVRDEAVVLVVDETGSRREPGRNCPPDGAKGHRYYDWAVIGLTDPAPQVHLATPSPGTITYQP